MAGRLAVMPRRVRGGAMISATSNVREAYAGDIVMARIARVESGHKDALARPPGGGLYQGFEGYRTPSDEQYRLALTTALVVLDTNVLLNLYRYNDQTRASIIDVIKALGERFWAPHQVLEEFWRNRERALSSPLTEVQQSVDNLEKQLDSAKETIRIWVNRAALTAQEAGAVEQQLTEAFNKAQSLIEELVDSEQVARARNTIHDKVLELLEPVLEGHVGQPMNPADYATTVAEGKRRAAAGEPPGFADARKSEVTSEGAAGDYLVWEQVLCEAARRKLDVVFVTGDVKRDWWRFEGSFPRGPHIKLARELTHRCGTQLYMIRPDMLLTYADALAVTVGKGSVEDVERTTRTEEARVQETKDETGWTAQALASLLEKLSTVGPVQEATIRLAAQQGGYISREEVYALGEYEPDRQLRGFTRPVNRLVQELRDSGELPADATDILLPVYDKMVHGLGWVDGFRVPAEIITFLQ
jgi:predicted nucleic acid-binding protein